MVDLFFMYTESVLRAGRVSLPSSALPTPGCSPQLHSPRWCSKQHVGRRDKEEYKGHAPAVSQRFPGAAM